MSKERYLKAKMENCCASGKYDYNRMQVQVLGQNLECEYGGYLKSLSNKRVAQSIDRGLKANGWRR